MSSNPASTPSTTVPVAPGAAPPIYYASIAPGPTIALPAPFGDACHRLEAELAMPLWMIIQNTNAAGEFADLYPPVRDALWSQRASLAAGQRVALLIDSPGGYARSAYEIARMLRRHTGSGFTAVVPRYAKSAATLLALGADEILMGEDAELGPLDAQVWDPEREEFSSALNEVQALERLNAASVEEIDQIVPLLIGRTGKKIETILPLVLDFVAQMKRPLLEKIDTVHYTQQSRVLKEAEDYAVRLLQSGGAYTDPHNIASRLVNNYSDHGFVIDREEAQQILNVSDAPTPAAATAIEDLADFMTTNELIALGRIQ